MRKPPPALMGLLLALALAGPALAHGLADKDAAFVAANRGPELVAFLYLGAKHMVTGYDHLLFLAGVIFFIYRLSHIALYVTLFSLGHSLTLLAGVLGNVHVDAYLVDAIIGLSVAYKAFDNLDGFKTLFGFSPDARFAVPAFGLAHGFGLATKIQELRPAREGLVANILAFNVGVEVGQLIALSIILGVIVAWRRLPGFQAQATWANAAILTAGFLLMNYQLAGYFLGAKA